jgi:sialic acid synthase SpsE
MSPRIGRRAVDAHGPVFAIAEIGLNHDGDPARALELVEGAAWAGATAVKLQTLDAECLVAADCPAPAHVNVPSLRDFFAAFELDADAHRAVAARAREHGMSVISTPLFEEAIPMLEALAIDAYKIASGDLTYDGLVAAAARTGKPLILSTGMSTLPEIAHAVGVARRAGAEGIVLLHCVSAYPAPVNAENLRAVTTLRQAFPGVPVGLSDHSPRGLASAVAAVALGASVYERHLMIDDRAIDRAVSSTPRELRDIVEAMDRTRLALGDGRKRCMPAERPNLAPGRRGLYARRALRAGHRITADDVIALRPASALAPADLPRLIHSVLTHDLPAGAPFREDDAAAIERAS